VNYKNKLYPNISG